MDSFGTIEELDFFNLKIDLYISRLECAGRRAGDCRGRHASAEIGRQMLNQTICWGARKARGHAHTIACDCGVERKSASRPISRVLSGHHGCPGNHSSRTFVTERLKQPTRTRRGPRHRVPIWPCSRRGLPSRGMLPPARCALTAPFHPYRPRARDVGGSLSVALSVGSRPPGVTWHLVLWSPDFPPATTDISVVAGDCLADSRSAA